MRISDWSSDVCSSDLDLVRPRLRDRDLLHPDALGRFALDQRLHGRGNLRGLAGDWRHGVAWRSGADARLYRPPGSPAPPCPPAFASMACLGLRFRADSPRTIPTGDSAFALVAS